MFTLGSTYSLKKHHLPSSSVPNHCVAGDNVGLIGDRVMSCARWTPNEHVSEVTVACVGWKCCLNDFPAQREIRNHECKHRHVFTVTVLFWKGWNLNVVIQRTWKRKNWHFSIVKDIPLTTKKCVRVCVCLYRPCVCQFLCNVGTSTPFRLGRYEYFLYYSLLIHYYLLLLIHQSKGQQSTGIFPATFQAILSWRGKCTLAFILTWLDILTLKCSIWKRC